MTERGQRHSRAERKKLWPAATPGLCNFRMKGYRRCKRHPMHGDPHCPIHRRARASDVNTWKGGHSEGFLRRYLPVRLMERYDKLVNNPELTSVRELLATSGARLSELLEKLPTRESGEAWAQIAELVARLGSFSADLKPKRKDEFTALVLSMEETLRSARSERALWNEIHGTIENARKLADTERRREEMLQGNLTAQQAIALFNNLFRLLAEEVADAKLRARLAEQIQGMLGQPKQLTSGESAA